MLCPAARTKPHISLELCPTAKAVLWSLCTAAVGSSAPTHNEQRAHPQTSACSGFWGRRRLPAPWARCLSAAPWHSGPPP